MELAQNEDVVSNGDTMTQISKSNKETHSTFSHLFPADLYTKRLSGGQEVEHNESVDMQQRKPMLAERESNVTVGADVTASSYERVAVDKFGTQVMKQLGWKGEGYGIGRNKEKAATAIEYIPRQHRLGLGATAVSREQLAKQGGDRRKLAVTETYEGGALGKNIKAINEELKVKD